MRINEHTVYLGDNGRALCGAHLGCTAKHTGHDLSGQRILPVTGKVLAEAVVLGISIACEECGRLAVPKGPIS